MNSRNGARYLYAVQHARDVPASLPAGIGGAAVRALTDGDVAAIVSDTGLAKVRPERRHLLAHHTVIQSLAAAGTVLPVAFGTIATSEVALRRMLRKHRNALAGELARLVDHVEMSVRLNWDVTDLFRHLIDVRPDLKAARDAMLALGSAVTRDDKIELGSRFERVLNEERARHAALVDEALDACCKEIRRDPPRHETEILHLTCLVRHAELGRFESGVAAASRELDDSLVLKYSGPCPPHHFVNLNMSL
ncbi:GvpL/GvpF family gas vesicle protein [Burkholderia humptydooensis]|uniref:GvpL/GvpF family gas vesicle protein n=2 Tax=Burkholderia humptydooensis TaxID=430531 RepID=A0A7U4P933_9BURK|nr:MULTISPECIES: GvpL/GvpF family gas vesicle protein [Burkholderia]ALX45236.1 gas vesicle protein GvpFL [Burkholderia humptydooensis]EIP85682.1 Gas vesicle synthesis GvpLGvpF [Burkholderia humptydooensis MSMB43]QPS46703.1 GvpL/GvpF family gas vesicle protein [Burkholderia humptydooensis]